MAPVRGLAGPDQHQSLCGSSVLTGKELAGGHTCGHGSGELRLGRPACNAQLLKLRRHGAAQASCHKDVLVHVPSPCLQLGKLRQSS